MCFQLYCGGHPYGDQPRYSKGVYKSLLGNDTLIAMSVTQPGELLRAKNQGQSMLPIPMTPLVPF